jgi:hypothetical protein
MTGAALLTSAPASAAGTHRHQGQVALTFDDLPGISLKEDDNAYVEALNRKLVTGLRR